MSTNIPERRGRRDRPPRVETVARVALALVDSGGLESLTMRRLATGLGVQLPTIYRLFGDKQSLLDEMAETILSGVPDRVRLPADTDTDADADWAGRAAAFARALRETLLDQRDAARIVGGSYAAKRPTLTLVEAMLAVMRDAGFAPDAAMWANTTIFCYVLGEVLEQQGADDSEAEVLGARVDAGLFSPLASVSIERFLDFDARFEFGLNVIIAGLRVALADQR